MNRNTCLFGALFLTAITALLGKEAGRFMEDSRISVPEARQGVASDGDFLYVISNHAISKIRKANGERVSAWECPEGEPLIHLNAGIVIGDRLYCAHSNYPGVPHLSSIEIWDTKTLHHVSSRSLGRTDGSLTWLDRRHGRWIACFVHYAKRGGEPGRGPEWTRLVEYDDEWREIGGWGLPPDLVAQLGKKGYSLSGGAVGPDGRLYVTGHDEPELHVLVFPEAGASLKWVSTLPIPAEGQAFGWDPVEPWGIHFILKRTREVISGRVIIPDVTIRQ